MTTGTDTNVFFRELLPYSVEIIIGKEESVDPHAVVIGEGTEDFYLVGTLAESFVTQLDQTLFVGPDFFHSSDGFDEF